LTNAPDFTPLTTSETLLNGCIYSIPVLGRRRLSFISPVDIPKRPGVQITAHLPPRASLRFSHARFELWTPGSSAPVIHKAKLQTERSAKAIGPDAEARFSTAGTLTNVSRQAAPIFLSVAEDIQLPRAFVLRIPPVYCFGIPLSIPDVYYRYFRSRNGLGICQFG
jgi:hypothetical protein